MKKYTKVLVTLSKFKNSILLIIIFILSFHSNAQSYGTNSFDWENVRYGGRFSFEFSNTTTSIIVSPLAVYQLNDQFSLGGSVSFGYTEFKLLDAKLYNYGVSLLSYYDVLPKLQLSGELEQVFVNQKSTNLGSQIRSNYNFLAMYLGAGYRVRRNVVVGMRYDVLHKEGKGLFASPFAPFVQVSF